MADTGATSPGTMADEDTVGTFTWSDVDNAKISNNTYAETTLLEGGPS